MNDTYPTIEQPQMSELKAFSRQLRALLDTGIFLEYARPTPHDVGIALHQAELLAHDIEYMCSELYKQYERACDTERERNVARTETQKIPTF